MRPVDAVVIETQRCIPKRMFGTVNGRAWGGGRETGIAPAAQRNIYFLDFRLPTTVFLLTIVMI